MREKTRDGDDVETDGTGLPAQSAPPPWDAFYGLMSTIEPVPDYMSDRPMNVFPEERDLFGEDD